MAMMDRIFPFCNRAWMIATMPAAAYHVQRAESAGGVLISGVWGLVRMEILAVQTIKHITAHPVLVVEETGCGLTLSARENS